MKKPRREIDDATAVKADIIVTNLKESMVSEEQGDLFGPIDRELSTLVTSSSWAICDREPSGPNVRSTNYLSQEQQRHRLFGMAMAITAYRLSRRGRGTEIDLG